MLRVEETWTPRKVLESQLSGTRRIERPTKRRRPDIEGNLRIADSR